VKLIWEKPNSTVMNNKNVDIKITYKIILSIKCYIYCLREAEQKKMLFAWVQR
jgi:hypothetical protein